MAHSALNSAYFGLASQLLRVGLLDAGQTDYALHQAQQQNISFISYLVKNNILSSQLLLDSCAKIFNLPTFNLDNYHIEWLEASGVSIELIQRYRVIPLAKMNTTLNLGITDPTDQSTLQAITFHTGLKITPVLVDETALERFIEALMHPKQKKTRLELSFLDVLNDEENLTVHENVVSYDEPIIHFVDNLIEHALQQSASDIHIEPYETTCRIRYRQDGLLYSIADIPTHLNSRLVTRLKVMARLDITERRLPQDGRFQANHHPIDVRINTCPTLYGEKVVLRLLDASKTSLDIDVLGFTDAQRNLLLASLAKPQGMILVTGPTGSGKTVTLYSALRHLNVTERNISTVEDPIEIQLPGINQVNINPKIGLAFSSVLRAFLRQDPDIIMVGEIRDHETAEIAVQAAQTGHLVLSSVHTNNAVETVTRLEAMGIPTYNLTSSISLIIAQRLIRKLCPHCKQPDILPQQALLDLGFSHFDFTVYRAMGCNACCQGYMGRVGIYEFFTFSSDAKQPGFQSLYDIALEKVSQGITSLAEIQRVIMS